MDLDTLFYVAIIVLYFVAQALSSKRRKKTAPKGSDRPAARRPAEPRRTAAPQAKRPAGQQDLDEALAEIRRALGWEPPKSEPPPSPTRAPEPTSTRAPKPTPARTQAPTPARTAETPRPRTTERVRARASVEPPAARPDLHTPRDLSSGQRTIPKSRLETRHADTSASARRARPVEQVAFESVPAEWEGLPHRERQRIPHREAPAPRQEDTSIRLDDLQKRLGTPDSAREAFLMSEIFNRRTRLRR